MEKRCENCAKSYMRILEKLEEYERKVLQERKKTAEIFAKLADEKSDYFNMGNGGIYKVVHIEDIYNICKEITGGE